MADAVTESTVLTALREVEDPELHRDIVTLNMVRDLKIEGPTVSMTLMLTTPACPLTGPFKEAVETALLAIPGVATAKVVLDAEVRSHRGATDRKPVEGVKNIIAVASNKGGVGKSTVSTNLSVALARHGAKVGLLDADITGPNVPTMMGFEAGLLAKAEGGLKPLEKYGVRVCSIGFALPKGTPVVWRGPMIGTAVRDFLHNIDWGELDYLIVDLPPGTSDASMSMVQEAPIAGAVIVSTPQAVALEDATKAVAMFDRLQVPVFGVIENMSYFEAPDTGIRYEIFGHGGAKMAAEELGLEFLGEIPLDPATREASDAGAPVTQAAPESAASKAFMAVAEKIAARCSVQNFIEETT
ncbi:MAG TPA: Mrp/NBP35 family ATP-binding protein [Dehalococcoidia bacterium]|nr:Mrp/NBP35 family ATP-binding protein [Dehalococcoidia bacterium]